jgi:hypothetical protein
MAAMMSNPNADHNSPYGLFYRALYVISSICIEHLDKPRTSERPQPTKGQGRSGLSS